MTEQQANLFEQEIENEDEDIESEESDDEEQGEEFQSEDFSSKPKGKKEYDKIQIAEQFPEKGMTLTIESVIPQKLFSTDPALQSKFGKYYKKKLVINFAEPFNERKLRELIPSVFYNIRDGKAVPTIPAACKKEDLDDNFTSKLSKLRYLYQTSFDVAEDQSDSEFIRDLVGKKVLVVKKIGKWKDAGITREFAELVITSFVK